jgi:hypothetical protein
VRKSGYKLPPRSNDGSLASLPPQERGYFGLTLFAAGAFLCTFLTPGWQADDFRLTMICIGLGQGLFLVPTVLYAARDVAPQQGPTA